MANIQIQSLPNFSGSPDDAGIFHYSEGGVDYKLSLAALLARLGGDYSTDIQAFLESATKEEARLNLAIDRRVTVNNADYSITANDLVIAQTGTLSQARNFTLPAANTVVAGSRFIIVDESGTANIVNKISIQRISTDLIDGQTSIDIKQPYGVVVLVCNGSNKWKVINAVAPAAQSNISNKNIIINGDFDIWQRGASFSAVANTQYTADRWRYEKQVATPIHTISRSSDVPSFAQAGRLILFSILVNCTTAYTTSNAANYVAISQAIEGLNFKDIAQKTFTLSFWVKATKVGIYCVGLTNAGADKSFVAEYLVNQPDTWEFKTITVSPSPSAGTWNYDNGLGLFVIFTLLSGSNRQTTAGSWQNGDFQATTNQVNACDSTSNNFQLSGVKVEAGSVATPFETEDGSELIDKCRQYFERKSIPFQIPAYTSSSTNATGILNFQKLKRRLPTISFSTASNFRFNNATNNYTVSALSAGTVSTESASINATISGASGNTGGTITNTIAGYVDIDSEL